MSLRALLVALLLCGGVAPAVAKRLAQGHVVVVRLPAEPLGRGLYESLRIQLVSRARVTAGPELAGASHDLRLDEATAILRSGAVTLVVWSEPADAKHTRLVIVGPFAPP